ncbi:hypothetical protein Taro_051226 [Colocasia esculenta]|uniref:Uncharacterized protein n=1 Tax=Colocasia esculenta TaxID=4460 RepID=A0A843XGH1_COLES|nr:hypothetical protein [Colocasia esculenta]
MYAAVVFVYFAFTVWSMETIKMEYCPASFSAIGQLYPERISDNRSGIWHMFNRSVHRSEVVCPEPRRISRAPFISDGCNRLFSKTKSVLPTHGGENLGILDIILCRDDPEGEYDSSNQMGFFCGSPPVRTSNPLIHDAEFEKETAVEASLGYSLRGNLTLARIEKAAPASSPLRNSHGLEASVSRVERAAQEPLGKFHGGKPLVVKMERASPSCGSSVGGKPKVRIEGFTSGNSDSNCVVPALA